MPRVHKHTEETREAAYDLVFRKKLPYLRVEMILGVRQQTLKTWFGPSPNWTPEDRTRVARESREQQRKEIQEKYEKIVYLRMKENKTNGEIAEILGISTESVYHYVGATPRRLGGYRPWDPAMRGRAYYLREAGYNVTEISEIIGVPRSTVGDWVNGMTCD